MPLRPRPSEFLSRPPQHCPPGQPQRGSVPHRDSWCRGWKRVELTHWLPTQMEGPPPGTLGCESCRERLGCCLLGHPWSHMGAGPSLPLSWACPVTRRGTPPSLPLEELQADRNQYVGTHEPRDAEQLAAAGGLRYHALSSASHTCGTQQV